MWQMLVVTLNKGGCNTLATYNKVVGSKVVVVSSIVVVLVGALVVNVSDLKIINLLSTILRFFGHQLLFLHLLLLCQKNDA